MVICCGLAWAPLAVASVAVPWFVVFAVTIWLAAPVVLLLVAGLLALRPERRARASALARGVGIAVALAFVPSAIVVSLAFSQMGDNYF